MPEVLDKDWKRRSPKDYTDDMRRKAISRLNDETRPLIEFTHACVLLDISRPAAYGIARNGGIPGAVSMEVTSKAGRRKTKWLIRRLELRKFLYGEE